MWPIATAAVSALMLGGGAARSEPAPVRIGVVLNALDNPFFAAIYQGIRSETERLGERTSVRAATSNADLAGQAGTSSQTTLETWKTGPATPKKEARPYRPGSPCVAAQYMQKPPKNNVFFGPWLTEFCPGIPGA